MVNHLASPFGRTVSTDLLVVVFADIDETFLSHTALSRSTYADEIFAAERIAVVLSSSMTRAQMQLAQQALGIREPFICESGAAILIPAGYFPFDVPRNREVPGYDVIAFGWPYTEIVSRLHRTADRLNTPVVGFSDETVEQVARARGLSLSHARLAKLREYDEPFRLVSPSREAHERLWRSLRASGLALTACGLSEHVGAPVSKSAAVQLLSSLYRRTFDAIVTTNVGLDADQPRGIPHLVNHALWIETIVEVAEAAREEYLASRAGH
jgi:mannosyl-3-phosphoglycerate phosphatase